MYSVFNPFSTFSHRASLQVALKHLEYKVEVGAVDVESLDCHDPNAMAALTDKLSESMVTVAVMGAVRILWCTESRSTRIVYFVEE